MRGEKSAWVRRSILGIVLIMVLACLAILESRQGILAQVNVVRRVNAPHFPDEVHDHYAETAVFWFGQVTPTENHVDGRVGYNDDYLYLSLTVFDRLVWYDRSPSLNDLTAWDAATVYLDLDGNVGDAPDGNAYRLVAQLSGSASREIYQATYTGDGSGWVVSSVPFTSSSFWRGDAANNNLDDRGWVLIYSIPFDSLGLSDPPAPGSVWGMALAVHDRDDAVGTHIADKAWPEAMEPQQSVTWGQLAFGLPTYTPPPASVVETVTIRQGWNGVVVPDADVGGGSVCGEGLDFWTEWGEANYAGEGDLNIQNQGDVGDWPCFSKYYVTFPLDTVPTGRAVLSATLTLHQFGNAGGGEWGDPSPSLIQVLTVAEDWDEAAVAWNNAPMAVTNISASWVDPLFSSPGWPGVPREWDVTQAVAEAYAAGQPVRLALYDADFAYHSGKYFVSSDSTIEEGRPALKVYVGAPLAVVRKAVEPIAPRTGQMVSYTLTLLGNGQALTLTDDLPPEVSEPGPIQVSGGPAPSYNPIAHRLTWYGIPAAGQAVTITFPVTVEIAGPRAVYNSVAVADAEGNTSTHTAIMFVDGYWVSLPIVLRNR